MAAETPTGTSSPTGAAVVEVAGLAHTFEGGRSVEVLAGLDLHVAPGTFVSLVGPSGCGKSTLLRVLAGLVTPMAGTAAVGGVSAIGQPGQAAYMPQKDNLLPWRRALANATLGAEITGVARADNDGVWRILPPDWEPIYGRE